MAEIFEANESQEAADGTIQNTEPAETDITGAGEDKVEEAVETIDVGSLDIDDKSKDEEPEITYKDYWQKNDEKARKDVMELYDDQLGKNLTQDTKRARLKLMCVVAYHGEKAIAVSTIDVRRTENYWCRIGYFRCLVHKDYRRKGVASQLMIQCKEVISNFSKENPGLKINGIGAHLQFNLIGERSRKPFWPEVNMSLVGYIENNLQVRIAWFDHVRFQY